MAGRRFGRRSRVVVWTEGEQEDRMQEVRVTVLRRSSSGAGEEQAPRERWREREEEEAWTREREGVRGERWWERVHWTPVMPALLPSPSAVARYRCWGRIVGCEGRLAWPREGGALSHEIPSWGTLAWILCLLLYLQQDRMPSPPDNM